MILLKHSTPLLHNDALDSSDLNHSHKFNKHYDLNTVQNFSYFLYQERSQ